MTTGVAFYNGIGNFILATPFLSKLEEPVVYLKDDDPRAEAVESISLWPVRYVNSLKEISPDHQEVFVLWGWPKDDKEIPGHIRQSKPDFFRPVHEVHHYLSLIGENKCDGTLIKVEPVQPPVKPPDTKLIALCNGANIGWEHKQWPDENWITLARMLAQGQDVRLIYIGSRAERALGDAVVASTGGACLNMAGELTFAQSAGMIGHCDLVVCNDTGLMHAADALYRPIIALWGWTFWHKNRPYNTAAMRLQCQSGGCVDFPCYGKPRMWECTNPLCMKTLTVDQVYAAVIGEIS